MGIILLAILFLLFSALFSGSEIAFVSASKLRVELNRKRGSRKGGIIAGFFNNPASFLSTMLVGNNIALVVFTYLMTRLLTPWIAPIVGGEILQLLTNTLIITLVVLIFGEFLPKMLFAFYADKLLNALAYPLLGLKYLLFLPAWIMTRLSSFLLEKVFRTAHEPVEQVFTRADLENFVINALAESEKEVDTDIFNRALYLQNTKVKDCMVSRQDIVHIDNSASVEELRQLFVETKLSRIIVIDGDIDEVKGYVHHLELLNGPKRISEVRLRELPFVPEVMRVRDLMNRFIKEHINIACVVDEYGSTVGIITLEDILEEIFGEIEDEHDQEDLMEKQVSENEFLFSGKWEIDYLNEKYDLNLPAGDYHTLSGYLVMTTAAIPAQGDTLDLAGHTFVLELVSETRIETVRVIKRADEDSTSSA